MMMEYRLEIDALNAIVREQKRTNELLEQLLVKSAKTGGLSVTKQKEEVVKLKVRGERA